MQRAQKLVLFMNNIIIHIIKIIMIVVIIIIIILYYYIISRLWFHKVLYYCLIFQYNVLFSQATKAQRPLKVPLSTFHVDQIMDLWVAFSQKEVETIHLSCIHIFSFGDIDRR